MSRKKHSRPEKVLVLRTCQADLTSYNGFQWPEQGPVECPDWNPDPVCGGGLHGLLWGRGDWTLLNSNPDAVWQAVEVEADSIVPIDEKKVKFHRGNVIYSGTMVQLVTMVLCHPNAMKSADRVSSGDYSTGASSGNYSRAASSGNYSTAASSGTCSRATSSGESSTAASSGNYSTAVAKGKDTIAMAAGVDCTVSAGENGCFAAVWYDPEHKRHRIKVGYVGEDGIKADTPYKLTQDGQWKEVKP